jgi:hypothetical protein
MENRKKREIAYKIHTSIEYEGKRITVDKANQLYIAYLAENNMDKAYELSNLIIIAKDQIRADFPDFSPE